MAKPDFTLMWENFPDHERYPDLTALHKFVGGTLAKNIDVPGFGPNGNTCAVRMSRALNYGGAPVSAEVVRSAGLNTMTGGDGKLYLFRVRELRTYLERTISATPEVVSGDFGHAFPGRRGIVAYEVKGWSDASGHFALWNGEQFREAHDDYRSLKDDPETPDILEPTVVRMFLWPL